MRQHPGCKVLRFLHSPNHTPVFHRASTLLDTCNPRYGYPRTWPEHVSELRKEVNGPRDAREATPASHTYLIPRLGTCIYNVAMESQYVPYRAQYERKSEYLGGQKAPLTSTCSITFGRRCAGGCAPTPTPRKLLSACVRETYKSPVGLSPATGR